MTETPETPLQALAKIVWRKLSPIQRNALRSAWIISGSKRRAIDYSTNMNVVTALRSPSCPLVEPGSYGLTLAGEAVRRSGVKLDAEAARPGDG